MQWVWLAIGLGFGFIAGWRAGRHRASSQSLLSQEQAEAKPRLASLGTDVERILRLAEQQADDHVSRARREAERIIAAAQRGQREGP